MKEINEQAERNKLLEEQQKSLKQKNEQAERNRLLEEHQNDELNKLLEEQKKNDRGRRRKKYSSEYNA